MITQDQMESALSFLAKTDMDYAVAMEHHERCAERKKSVLAVLKGAHEGSVAAKDAFAYAHPDYERARDDYFDAFREVNLLKNRRETARLRVVTWPSAEKAQRDKLL